MHKFLILIILGFPAWISAQTNAETPKDSIFTADNSLSYPQTDSLTNVYYYSGQWKELIKTGKSAIRQQIDFKRLRQKMGYAYYMLGDNYSAMREYEQALAFDKTDINTRIYLYWCGLNTANESYARYQVGELPRDIQPTFPVKPFRWVDAVDLEYNYKSNNSSLRSNPNYLRLGLSTRLGYQLSLYQAFSSYSQSLDSVGTQYEFFRRSKVVQNEYYVSLNWKPDLRFDFTLAYHTVSMKGTDSISYIIPLLARKTLIDTTNLSGNLFFGKIGYRYNRFEFGVSGSLFGFNKLLTQQYSLQAAVTLPGKLNLKISSKVDALLDNETRRLVFSQNVGLAPLKNIWLEGNVTLGNLKNYAEYSGLYILNSKDPTLFKTGVTTFWQISGNLSIFGNYIYETKQIIETNNSSSNYIQNSFSGGIIWKI